MEQFPMWRGTPWVVGAFMLALTLASFIVCHKEQIPLAHFLRILGTVVAVLSIGLSLRLMASHYLRQPTTPLELIGSSRRVGTDLELELEYWRALHRFNRTRQVIRLISLVPFYSLFAVVPLWKSDGWVPVLMSHLTDTCEAFITFTFFSWMMNECISFVLPPEHEIVSDCSTRKEMEGALSYFSTHRSDSNPVGQWDPEADVEELRLIGRRVAAEYWKTWCSSLNGRLQSRGGVWSFLANRKRIWLVVGNPRVLSFARTFLSLYFVANVVLTILSMVCLGAGIFVEGVLSFQNTYLYIYGSRLLFLTPALVPLVTVLVILRNTLREEDPVKKFATVKLIVFIGVWQRFVLTVLEKKGKLPTELPGPSEVLVLDNFFTCMEMFVAVFVNELVFPAPLSAVSSAGSQGEMKEDSALLSSESPKSKLNLNGEGDLSSPPLAAGQLRLPKRKLILLGDFVVAVVAPLRALCR